MGLFTSGIPIERHIGDVLSHESESVKSFFFAILLFLDGDIVRSNSSVFWQGRLQHSVSCQPSLLYQSLFWLIIYLVQITLLRASHGGWVCFKQPCGTWNNRCIRLRPEMWLLTDSLLFQRQRFFGGGNGTHAVFETGCYYWTTNSYLFCVRVCLCVCSSRWAWHLVSNCQRLDKRHVPTLTNATVWFPHSPSERSLCICSRYRRDAVWTTCIRGMETLHNHPTVYLRADQPTLWKIGFSTRWNHKRFLILTLLHCLYRTHVALQGCEIMRLLNYCKKQKTKTKETLIKQKKQQQKNPHTQLKEELLVV